MANLQPVFIFDFDGTIADDFHVAMEGIAGRSLDGQYLERLRGNSSREAIRVLGIPW